MLQPVIIAGGSGTRLWPLSRQLYPKQLLPKSNKKLFLYSLMDYSIGAKSLYPTLVRNRHDYGAL